MHTNGIDIHTPCERDDAREDLVHLVNDGAAFAARDERTVRLIRAVGERFARRAQTRAFRRGDEL